MTAAKQLIDHKLLRSLSPLCDLTPDMLTELSVKSRVEQVPAGVTIFKAAERDHRTLYLISGKLDITDATGRTTRLVANTKQARQPLDPVMPRSVTAVSTTPVVLLNIDTSLLEMLTNWGRNQTYEVSSLDMSEEEETDWMSRFLQSKVFLKLRAENIQAMMMRMEEIEVHTNDVIIKQGDKDENYYIIAKGKAQVARRATPDAPVMKVAVLTAGNGFGEEALIGNSERNASVIMMEDGKLMRLSKQDFIDLLVEPVLQYLTYDDARALGESGVEWLDVRKLDEYSRGTLPGAKNTPATELRMGLRKFNKLHKYIVFSDTDDHAAAAVFLLSQYGLDAYVLKNALAEIAKVSPPKPKPKPKPEPKAAPEPAPVKEVAKEDTASNVVTLRNEKPSGRSEKPSGGDGQIAAMMDSARKRVEQEMQRAEATEIARKKAQEEVARLKAEVEASRKRMEEEARRAASQAKTEVEKAAAQKRNEEVAKEQAEREEALKRAEAEAARAKMAEAARQAAEQEIERLKKEAEKAQQVSERAQAAESEVERLKQQAEAARREAAVQAKLAADEAQTKAERKIAAQRAKEMEQLQAEREEMARRAEIEASRAHVAEEARRKAEAEIQRLKVDAEVARMQVEEQAQRVADAARSEAERESARAQAAEAARLQAEEELEALAVKAEHMRMEAEEQARMAADAARSEAEREAALLRAEELAEQQSQLEEIAQRAEEEAERARMADEARQRAENEIARRQLQAEEAARRAEEEARRAWEAEDARRKMEEEMAQLRAEAAAARAVMEQQARQFAAAQQGAQEEKARKEAEEAAELQRQQEAEAERLAEEEAAKRQQKADELARKAAEEAKRAKVDAETLRKQAEEEILKLRAEAEAARIRAEIEVKRSLAAARREIDEKAAKDKVMERARARLSGTHNDDASSRAQRARAARAAALENMGNDDNDMAELFGIGYKGDASVSDEFADIEPIKKDNVSENSNLVDPTEVMKVDTTERKRAWVSDDLAWEAAVGYRKDNDVERYDSSPADSVKKPAENLEEKITSRQVTKSIPEPIVEIGEKVEFKTETEAVKSPFESRDVDRTIQPQVVKPSGNRVRVGPGISKVKVAMVGLVVIVAVAAGGWFYSKQASAPKGLKHVVAKSTNEIKQVVDQGTESLTQLKDKIAEKINELKSGLTGKDKEVTEEQLASLRERLQKLKEESSQSAKKMAKERQATAGEKAATVLSAPSKLRPVVKKTVTHVTQKPVAKPVAVTTSQNSQQVESEPVSEPKVVDSVDSLPVIGADADKQTTDSSDAKTVDTTQ